MRIDELAWICQEAVRDLVDRRPRPVPTAVVLPGPDATRVVELPDFPDDDAGRRHLLDRLAHDEVVARSIPAYGFVAEADVAGTDAVVVVYGAHGHAPRITAAAIDDDGHLGEFAPDEPLADEAMAFLHPLQHAVEHVREPPEPPGIPGFPT